MVNIRSLSALLALASISLVAAAPAPVPSDAPVPAPEGVFDGNVTFVYLSKEDAAAAVFLPFLSHLELPAPFSATALIFVAFSIPKPFSRKLTKSSTA
jgi:hypothetical protein